ncbi:MAG: hypothetical protein DMG63_06010 [Acidobacteria bacterium]|nr:MAG: hypothetical protein DMG63_06010 [Acidobacteriota bacterium]
MIPLPTRGWAMVLSTSPPDFPNSPTRKTIIITTSMSVARGIWGTTTRAPFRFTIPRHRNLLPLIASSRRFHRIHRVWGAQHTDAKHLAPVDCTNASTPCAGGQTDYFTDLKSGNFPSVALIEPGFESGRDEHPGNPVQLGAVYDMKLIQAFMSSPIWKDGVFFLTYDEAGGFYDHVQPMTAVQPDGIAPKDLLSKDPAGDFTRTGFRIPLMVVSPYVKPHFVSHQPSDTTSILKFIEQRFNLPNLTKRDAAQPDLDFFDFTKAAWATPPTLPNQPADAPCAAYAKNP